MKTIKKTSKITIGLPTYNGEAYVRQAIDSLLSQTYIDFRLVISDDASTDKTLDICREYLNDARVALINNIENVGGQRNLQNILDGVNTKYFVWASQDDYWAPNFLSLLIEKLESSPGMSLAFSDVVFLDEAGKYSRYRFDKSWSRFASSKYGLITALLLPVDSFGWYKSNLAIHGVVRTEVLKKSLDLLRGVATHDRIYVLFTILCGKWIYLNEPLYFRRTYTGIALRTQSKDPIFLAQRSFFSPVISAFKMVHGVASMSGVEFKLKAFAFLAVLGYLTSSYLAKSIGCISMILKTGLPESFFVAVRFIYRRILGK